jgi:import receptor subunit TOM22
VTYYQKRFQQPRTARKMVKVEIVQDQDATTGQSPYGSPASSRTSSSASLSSVESDFPTEETLYERVTALKDIVPPSTRHAISSKLSTTSSFFKRSGKVLGNVVWIVTTSALLVGLPLALSLEDEAKIVAQEKEMLAQQQGAQQVRSRKSMLFPPSRSSNCLLLFLQMLSGGSSMYPMPGSNPNQQPKAIVPPGF